MAIDVSGLDKKRGKKILKALKKEWNIDIFDLRNDTASLSGQGNLTGGESEDEFAERTTRAVWTANRGYCAVRVKATYLEDLPCETYSFGRKEYREFMKNQKMN
jgi:hypothetical protein